MTPQKQMFHHRPDDGEYGDCQRTVFACLLDLSRDDVPHFGADNATSEAHLAHIDQWLASFGLYEAKQIYDGEVPLEEILGHVGKLNPGQHYMLSGTSRSGCNHVVVCLNDKIAWDTSLTNSGIVGPCDDGWYWVSFLARKL